MGMFDTFHLQDRGRELPVQSKQFACVLDNYHLGDFVRFDQATPQGVAAWIEDHKQDWSTPTCPLEWVVLLLVDGCFLDAFVTDTETGARQAADVMVKLWQSPERQAEAFRRHALAHYDARTSQAQALDRIAALLRDYVDWQTRKEKGEPDPGLFRLFRHDFEKEDWDWAIARMLLELPEYRGRVPESYAVRAEMEAANPKQGEQP